MSDDAKIVPRGSSTSFVAPASRAYSQSIFRHRNAGLRHGGATVIHRLIEWSLRNRFLVLCGSLLLFGWGWKALVTTPVDAIPDLSENQVIVFADWPGRSPQEVEDQVTYPLSANLQGLA